MFSFLPLPSLLLPFGPLPRDSCLWQTLDILLRDHKKQVSYITEPRSSRKNTRILLGKLICSGTFSYLQSPNPISPICLYLGKPEDLGTSFYTMTQLSFRLTEKSRSQPWTVFLSFLFNYLATKKTNTWANLEAFGPLVPQSVEPSWILGPGEGGYIFFKTRTQHFLPFYIN